MCALLFARLGVADGFADHACRVATGACSRAVFRSGAPPAPARVATALRAAAATATAAAAPCAETANSEVQQLLADGRLSKTSLGKLKVAALREECAALGLPAEGMKPDLVARLLGWAAAAQLDGRQRQQQQQQDCEEQEGEGEEQQAWQQAQPGEDHVADEVAAAAAAAEAGPDTGVAEPAEATARSSAVQQEQQQLQDQTPVASAAPARDSHHSRRRPSSDVSVTWLGTSSGNPTPRRNVSSIAVRMGGELYLVDVGEGTRNQLRRAGVDPGSIRRIFVTHMHGDHCFGLAGLVSAICQASWLRAATSYAAAAAASNAAPAAASNAAPPGC